MGVPVAMMMMCVCVGERTLQLLRVRHHWPEFVGCGVSPLALVAPSLPFTPPPCAEQ